MNILLYHLSIVIKDCCLQHASNSERGWIDLFDCVSCIHNVLISFPVTEFPIRKVMNIVILAIHCLLK